MKKCDVIIPVYKSPEWVKLCIYSLFKNTDIEVLNKVYLINDSNDELTINCLKNLSKKYSKIEIIQNEENLGFVKSTNKGMKKSTSDYVLLLNTDCIISKNTISKLIKHIENNNKIGMICPISSNAANLTLEMFNGFSFMEMDKLLERKFKGQEFDACTVVGNCLMITRKCIEKIGYLDEIYGMGYGEETDYQFKAMESGFDAKVAIDTYVFHKSEVSFGISKEKTERLRKNREIFFERWGKQYNKLIKEYNKNDPITYILNNLTEEDKKNDFEFLIYLIGFANAGGVHMTVDMINYLVINGINCNVLYGFSNGYSEIMLFNPIQTKDVDNFRFNKIVSTIYYSTFYAKKIADKLNIPLLYFAQGYEPYFDDGIDYGIAELSYKLADEILTISKYLKNRYSDMFKIESTVINNGINYDLLYKENINDKIKTITVLLRDNVLKGDYILLDLVKKISNKFNNLEINILYNNNNLNFPFFNNDKIKVNKIKGPFNRKKLASIFQKSDLYIDASVTEGFGLVALEAMAAGNVVIVSDSGGINDYISDGKNGFIVKEINNADCYVEKIEKLLNDINLYKAIKKNMKQTISEYDYDDIVSKYINYFMKNYKKKNLKLTNEELMLYEKVLDNKFKVSINNRKKNILYMICKKTPKRFRILIKKNVEKLYKFINVR